MEIYIKIRACSFEVFETLKMINKSVIYKIRLKALNREIYRISFFELFGSKDS